MKEYPDWLELKDDEKEFKTDISLVDDYTFEKDNNKEDDIYND